ncbi:uncharacterized protein [Spinacia oleracea]|uniref:Retrotransposon gag domain-containing protein n=1 Tax=Spinacia oleracea TaxID=3562 RepID=A0A9R0JNG2_SPIOL|nr:uncharacterized protein LOC110781217 [Spinacia oleracea]
MAPKVAISIPYMVEVKPLWDYLDKRFCVSTGPRLQQLRAKIIGCKQAKGMTIADYYNTLMSFYDDLAQLKPPHGCKCGLCTCDVAGRYEVDKAEEKFHQFLIGLDDDLYAVVRTNLLSQKPPASIEDALEVLLQEEQSRGIAAGKAAKDTIEAHAFAVPLDRWKGNNDRWKDK